MGLRRLRHAPDAQGGCGEEERPDCPGVGRGHEALDGRERGGGGGHCGAGPAPRAGAGGRPAGRAGHAAAVEGREAGPGAELERRRCSSRGEGISKDGLPPPNGARARDDRGAKRCLNCGHHGKLLEVPQKHETKRAARNVYIQFSTEPAAS